VAVSQENTQFMVDLVVVVMILFPIVSFFAPFFVRMGWDISGKLFGMADLCGDKLFSWIGKQFKRFTKKRL